MNCAYDVSVIVPCLNEEGNIEKLFAALHSEFQQMGYTCEYIFVDDGSTDGTLELLRGLSKNNVHVRYLSFSRNFGHQPALLAGMKAATGRACIMLDADLQHPVSLLPRMLELWNAGYKVVNTSRIDGRSTGWLKRYSSKLFYRFLNFLSDYPLLPGSADFRLLDRRVVDAVLTCAGDMQFLRGLIAWCGFRQTSLSYVPESRYAGKTNYSPRRMISLALSGITSFSIRPLRLGIFLSGIFALLSLSEIIYVFYVSLFTDRTVSGWASLAILISVLGTVVLLLLGIIGEYVGRCFMQGKQRPSYLVAEYGGGDEQ